MTVSPLLETHTAALAVGVKAAAIEQGFDLVGIASADPSQFRDYLRRWLDEGRHGDMAYLAERFDVRVDPREYLPGAKSVICVAKNYYVGLQPLAEADMSRHGKVARYALGRDYHDHLKKRLYRLADWIKKAVPDSETKCAVDTAPVMEREMAARSGIGWVGKNTCIINRKAGSFLLLGQIVTTLDLAADEPETDHCGTCTRCIEACPTQAIVAPYELDARRCISYLTIEHRGPIEPELQRQMGEWVFGCDICQDVCPHNRKPPEATDVHLQPRLPTGTIDVEAARHWTLEQYHEATRHTAIRRAKLPQLQRNAEIVWQNLNDQRKQDGK